MKYCEMLEYVRKGGFYPIQVVIADEVDCQLEVKVSVNEFEDICYRIYDKYLDSTDIDIWELVNEELKNRGCK